MKNLNKTLALLISGGLLSGSVANAAIVANGDFASAPPSAYSLNSGAAAYYLDEGTGNILWGGNSSPYNGTTDTGTDVNQWFSTAVGGIPTYGASVGNGGGGGLTATGQSSPSNDRPRAILQFAQDNKATTGTISITIDMKFNAINTGMFGNIELYGWNSGDTGPKLSLGGGTANDPTFNATELGTATNLLGSTGVQIAASGFTADVWKTVTVASSLNLGTGYDFYAWRVGIVGANPATDVASFDNLTVVPEPSTFALLGLGFLGLLARRRA